MTETDAEFVERMQKFPRDNLEANEVADVDRLLALARRGAAVQWRPISKMSGEGPFIVFGGRWVGEIAGTSARTNAGALVDENLYVEGTDYYSATINNPTHFISLAALGEPNE